MLPVEHNDPINAKILAISEDKIEGFVREPFQEIANRSGLGVNVVMTRIGAMLRAGTIRRVRQTLLATNLAQGALVAWKVPDEKIDTAFDWMFQRDPFSGHVVLRSTDTVSAGSDYKLWTTVKVPRDFHSKPIANGWRKKSEPSVFALCRQRNFHPRSGTCSPENDRAGQQSGSAGKNDSSAVCQSK